MEQRFFLRLLPGPWFEVSKADFVRAERGAGFHNTMGYPDEPATSGFSNGVSQGRTVYSVNTAEQYDFDPEFRDVAFP